MGHGRAIPLAQTQAVTEVDGDPKAPQGRLTSGLPAQRTDGQIPITAVREVNALVTVDEIKIVVVQ